MTALFFFFAACMAGMGGFAYLLVAAIEFGALGRPRPGSWLSVADGMTFGVVSVARGIVQHWTAVSALRRLVCVGCGALILGAICVGMALTTLN
jgi:hypothetical protein